MSEPEIAQASLDFGSADDDDGLVIIGTPRGAAGKQSHSTFRKIDMAAKQGKLVSLSWGDLMVMLPRSLYERVYAYAVAEHHDSRADALAALFEEGLAACSD